MTPTETLRHEHEIILRVLDAAGREAHSIRDTHQVDAARIETMLDFFRTFADGCHHAKEEKHLFPKLGERGLPMGAGPVAVMLYEHDQGRGHLRAIAGALPEARRGEKAAIDTVALRLATYVDLLREHIAKENNVLFPMADQILSPDDQEELSEQFEKVEKEEIGEGVHEKYHALAHELTRS